MLIWDRFDAFSTRLPRTLTAGSAHLASAGAAATANGASADAGFQKFLDAVKSGANLVPLSQRIFSDHLTPVSAYR
jgi:hypothetical protein